MSTHNRISVLREKDTRKSDTLLSPLSLPFAKDAEVTIYKVTFTRIPEPALDRVLPRTQIDDSEYLLEVPGYSVFLPQPQLIKHLSNSTLSNLQFTLQLEGSPEVVPLMVKPHPLHPPHTQELMSQTSTQAALRGVSVLFPNTKHPQHPLRSLMSPAGEPPPASVTGEESSHLLSHSAFIDLSRKS